MTLRVLVVEDDREIRALMQSSLSVEGFEVQTAVSLSEASALLRHSLPDVIVLDLGLPDGDGVQLVREVRTRHSLPIIVVSARHQEAQKIQLLDAGADDYLTKPFSVGELLASTICALIGPPTASCATVSCCISRRPSSSCSRAWCAVRAGWSRIGNCWSMSGGPSSRSTRIICGSTWPSCGPRSSATRPNRAIC
jgi:CheY-like chemotaxis protein